MLNITHYQRNANQNHSEVPSHAGQNAAAAAAKSLQPCPTLSDPMDYSRPGSSVHGISQTRVLEWGAIAFFGQSGWLLSKSLQAIKLERVWREGNPLILLLGIQTSTATMENSVEIP